MKHVVKWLIRWDKRSAQDKGLILFRLRYVVAAMIAWLPIPIWSVLQWAGSDKHNANDHSYGRTYQALFRPMKYRPVRLLEVGVGGSGDDIGGRSLLAWCADFPRASVIGFDMQERSLLSTGRIVVRQGDQASPADLARLAREFGPFDIIIDDGSHLSAHQLLTFHHLFDAVSDRGLYIIEDLATSYWPFKVGPVRWDGAHPEDPAFATTCMGSLLQLAKYLNHAELLAPLDEASPFAVARRIRRMSFEHNLIVIEKGSNEGQSTLWRLHRSGYPIEPEALMHERQ